MRPASERAAPRLQRRREHRHARGHDGSRGFTLPELLLGAAIATLLLTLALPSYGALRQRTALRAAAVTLLADLRRARAASLRLLRPVHVTLRAGAGAGDWCYGLNPDRPCDCRRPGACRLGRGSAAGFGAPVTLALRPAAGRDGFSFAPPRGFSRTGRIVLQSGEWRVALLRSAFGRLRLCGPDRPTLGYPRC